MRTWEIYLESSCKQNHRWRKLFSCRRDCQHILCPCKGTAYDVHTHQLQMICFSTLLHLSTAKCRHSLHRNYAKAALLLHMWSVDSPGWRGPEISPLHRHMHTHLCVHSYSILPRAVVKSSRQQVKKQEPGSPTAVLKCSWTPAFMMCTVSNNSCCCNKYCPLQKTNAQFFCFQ